MLIIDSEVHLNIPSAMTGIKGRNKIVRVGTIVELDEWVIICNCKLSPIFGEFEICGYFWIPTECFKDSFVGGTP